jgi:hypothetical protein
MLPDFDRADAVGTFWGHPEMRSLGELLIDPEEDKAEHPLRGAVWMTSAQPLAPSCSAS